MLKKLCMIGFVGLAVTLMPGWRLAAQRDVDILPNDSCVRCHSKVTTPLSLSNRYYDWHVSLHRDNRIGCEKCHGGDPAAKNKKAAHQGVLPATNTNSRVHSRNLPETCGACHQAVVTSFVESTHYQKLKSSGMGPSCSTCHGHMASMVVQNPTETAALCARCHNTVNGPLPARPDIPEKAKQVMEALNRANSIVIWAERLMEVGQQKKLDLATEADGLRQVKSLLSEAKVGWHALVFEAVRKKADQAFEQGTQVKDQLLGKLYPKPTQ